MNSIDRGVRQCALTVVRPADDRDDLVLEPGARDRAAEDRQRVHQPELGVDEGGVVVLPAGLVLLRAAVVVDGEDRAADLAGRRAEVDRGLAAVGADLERRAVGESLAGVAVQQQPLVLGHEALGGECVADPVGGHGRTLVGLEHVLVSALRMRMSIGISEEHVELAASLRKWAADLDGRELARAAEDGRRRDVRRRVVGAGRRWASPTIGLPEAAGGGGGTTLDVAVALEACAHELVPGPLLGPAVAAAVLGELPEDAVVGHRARRRRLGRAVRDARAAVDADGLAAAARARRSS